MSSNGLKRNLGDLSYLDTSESEHEDEDGFETCRENRRRQGKMVKRKLGVVSLSIQEIESTVRKLPDLNHTEKEEALANIEGLPDQNLQTLLWHLGCNFVLHGHQFKGVRVMAGLSEDFPDGATCTMDSLVNAKPRRVGERGILVADVMGLGKTVQAVVACILRNRIFEEKGKPKKPTLICSPNESVLHQWHEHLILAGVDPEKIFRFKTKQKKPIQGDIYVLCTRYDFQTEIRCTFDSMKPSPLVVPFKSQLFPSASNKLLRVLLNQYLFEKGKEKNKYENKDRPMTINECITKNLAEACRSNSNDILFRTVVIDEAHFLKNLKTQWGMTAALVGLHTQRMLPMSGTPYNNGCQDLATLMNFINPTEKWAKEKWWKEATNSGGSRRVAEAVKEWSSTCLLRRGKDVIADKLPKKEVRKVAITSCIVEARVYREYEITFEKVLGRLKNAQGGNNRREEKKCLDIMLRTVHCMCSALIHPLLPRGGRGLTALFSPTRRKMKSVMSGMEKRDQCVCCDRRVKLHVKKSGGANRKRPDVFDRLGGDEDVMDEDDDLFIEKDDDSESGDDSGAEEAKKKKPYIPFKIKGKGPIVKIPSKICRLEGQGPCHFACESCLDKLEETKASCPCCHDLFSRKDFINYVGDVASENPTAGVAPLVAAGASVSPSLVGLGVVEMSGNGTGVAPAVPVPAPTPVPRKVYCQEILGGFRASAKLESIMSDYKTKLPPDEKVLIVSFCKGTLDLLEAIFAEDKVEVARFDGDINCEEREKELDVFKSQGSCRVLLMTVQTGGTGLNLTCANHVWFADRHWNPMVMEQCEDRCFRLGQEREVDVANHDVCRTVDDVMCDINRKKKENAAIILADGTALSTPGMSFNEISGELGKKLGLERDERDAIRSEESLDSILSKKPAARSARKARGSGHSSISYIGGTEPSPDRTFSIAASSRPKVAGYPASHQSAQYPTPAAVARRPNRSTVQADWAQRSGFDTLDGYEDPPQPECPSTKTNAWAERSNFAALFRNGQRTLAESPETPVSLPPWFEDDDEVVDPVVQLRQLVDDDQLDEETGNLYLEMCQGDVVQAASLYTDHYGSSQPAPIATSSSSGPTQSFSEKLLSKKQAKRPARDDDSSAADNGEAEVVCVGVSQPQKRVKKTAGLKSTGDNNDERSANGREDQPEVIEID